MLDVVGVGAAATAVRSCTMVPEVPAAASVCRAAAFWRAYSSRDTVLMMRTRSLSTARSESRIAACVMSAI